MEKIDFDYSQMTRIDVFGLMVLEPFTVLTDLVITAVCIYAWFKLKHKAKEHQVYRLMRYFFITMGLATAVGGILGHGLLYFTGLQGKVPGWFISMISVAFFERAAIRHSRPLMHNHLGKFFSILNYVELSTFMLLSFFTLKFLFVEIHAVYGLFIVVFFLEIFVYKMRKDKGSVFIFAGTFFAAAAAVSHALRIGINEWFNHNDVSHIGMAISVYFYYLGAKAMKVYDQDTVEY